ncbi:MAG: hypothetical protein ABR99_00765 [Rhodobacter sp. BACL10 MAG-121220-bin24]|nr:MAG: hypothetical protein ABR99_00765 [Rhodobacter sp. BACL10 MAG-121220-bin24]HCB53023.1 hypothetical protein [Rhodobacter sp.]
MRYQSGGYPLPSWRVLDNAMPRVQRTKHRRAINCTKFLEKAPIFLISRARAAGGGQKFT